MIRPERFYLFYMGRCPICFLQNISLIRLVVLEKKIFEGFLPYLNMAATLNFGSTFRSPSAWILHMKFGYIWPSGFRGEVV